MLDRVIVVDFMFGLNDVVFVEVVTFYAACSLVDFLVVVVSLDGELREVKFSGLVHGSGTTGHLGNADCAQI